MLPVTVIVLFVAASFAAWWFFTRGRTANASPVPSPTPSKTPSPTTSPTPSKTPSPTTSPTALKPAPAPQTALAGRCVQKEGFHKPRNETEKQKAAFYVAKAHEFVGHLRRVHPDNQMTKTLVDKWKGEVVLFNIPDGPGGRYSRGCIMLNPFKNMPPGEMESDGRMLTRLLHELAHSWSGPHNAEFYAANRWFLQVASAEMGWKLDVNCRVCCHYDGGACRTACPKCHWIEDPATCTLKRKQNCGEQ